MVIELGGSVFLKNTHDLLGDLFRAKNAGVTPSQMVTKLVTEGDATWHDPCWLLTWQGAC
jgi:hypothetical protein